MYLIIKIFTIVQIMYYSEFLGTTTSHNPNPSKQSIEENLEKITKYLTNKDIAALKQTCQSFYYYFVTADLWVSLKSSIAEKKLEYLEDYDYEEKEATQILTKKDKNIRIHSLKKQSQSRKLNIAKRQPSNAQPKTRIAPQTNELLFRNTEVGFKRLLRVGSKKKPNEIDYDVKDLMQLPKIGELHEYLIKLGDPWSVNVSKANKLGELFKKINEFHNKFLTELKMPCKEIDELTKKICRAEENCNKYIETINKEPYRSAIKSVQGAQQDLLISEQLNKVCRLFWKYHVSMLKMHPQIKLFRELMEKERLRVLGLSRHTKKQAVQFVQSLSGVDQSVQAQSGFCENNAELSKIIAPQVISIYGSIIEELQKQTIIFDDSERHTKLSSLSWDSLLSSPFFSQTVFQILISLSQKLLKISTSHCPDNLVVSITVARLRNTKTVAQALINVARYFGKIRKQLEEKEKKGREDKSMAAIRQFLAQFEERVDEQLYLVKNPAKLESIIADFKQKIGVLKNRIQNSTV